MALTVNEIDSIARQLRLCAPHLADEVERLAAAARREHAPKPVAYVEVTKTDGTVEVMRAKDYQRLTATDLAHAKLRVLTQAEVAKRGLGKTTK